MMRFTFLAASACSALLLLGCGSMSVTNPVSLPIERVEYQPPSPEQWKLPNGMTVMFLKNPELPIVSGFLFTRGGSFWEPKSSPGVVPALGAEMRDGGAGSRSPQEMDKQLEELAAEIRTQFADEYGMASFSSLSKDFDTVLSMFADVVRRPRFDQARFDLWKSNAVDSIARRTEDPGTVAQLSFRSLIYGPDTVFGRTNLVSDVRSIDRADLMSVHKELVQPDGAVFAISGDLDRAQVEELINKYFGSWKREGHALPPVPWIEHQVKPGIYYIDLPFQQATIFMGQLGVPRFTPDFIAIDGFNQIFGAGGFSNRLTDQVRTTLGLAYVTYGSISPRLIPGVNIMTVQTKVGSAAQAILASMQVLQDMQQSEVSDQSLASMKREIENSYVFNFDSTGAIIKREAMLDLLHFPEDYDATYLNKLNALTAADIQSVAKNRWDLSKFVIVVVGNREALKSLEDLESQHPPLLDGYQIKEVGFDQELKGVS